MIKVACTTSLLMKATGELSFLLRTLLFDALLSRYIPYPELMSTLVGYIWREAHRLENVPDSSVLGPRAVGREGEGIKALRWGPIRQ